MMGTRVAFGRGDRVQLRYVADDTDDPGEVICQEGAMVGLRWIESDVWAWVRFDDLRLVDTESTR